MTNPANLAHAFAADFRQMEYAMKRSGFLRENREIAEADWRLLANQLGDRFFDHIVDAGLAKTLIGDPPRRLLSNMKWSPPNPKPLSNVTQLLIEGVCRVRNSYTHGEKFVGGPEGQWKRDATLIVEAHAVLKEAISWLAEITPQRS